MGLDIIEIIMDVEDKFQITIADSEAEAFQTVADLHALIACKLNRFPKDVRPTARAFRRLRQSLVAAGVPRPAIRPHSPLDATLPPNRRRQLWRTFTAAPTPLRFPSLSLSRRAFNICLAATFALTLLTTLACWQLFHANPLLWVLLTLPLSATLIFLLSRPFATALANTPTIADLTHGILTHNLPRFVPPNHSISSDDIYLTLRRLIAENLKCPESSITPKTKVADLF